MRAITTVPPGGGVKLSEVNEEKGDGIRVRTFRTGICGTDKEIAAGKLSFARPEIGNSLIIGHEAVGVDNLLINLNPQAWFPAQGEMSIIQIVS